MLRLHMVALVGVLVALAALTGCSSADQKTGNSPEDIAHMADFLPDRPPSLIVRKGDERTEEFPPTDSMWGQTSESVQLGDDAPEFKWMGDDLLVDRGTSLELVLDNEPTFLDIAFFEDGIDDTGRAENGRIDRIPVCQKHPEGHVANCRDVHLESGAYVIPLPFEKINKGGERTYFVVSLFVEGIDPNSNELAAFTANWNIPLIFEEGES